MKKLSLLLLALAFALAAAVSGCCDQVADQNSAGPVALAKADQGAAAMVTSGRTQTPSDQAETKAGDAKPVPPAATKPAPADAKAPAEKAPAAPAAEKKIPAGEPIKIGAIFAVTGPASSLGLPEKQTVEMLQEKINATGGILGRPLQVIVYDDKGDPKETVNFANRLIQNDKVAAVIGPTTSGTSLAIIDALSEAQIPLVSCAASFKIVTDDAGKARKWIFKTPQSDSLAVEKIFDYLNQKQISKIAIMSSADGYGESGRDELKRLAPNYKIEILADEQFGPQDPDMNAQLTKIKGTVSKAIVIWGIQKAPAIIAQNAKTLGLTQLIIQSHGVASKTFIELCGDAADGQVLPAGRLIVVDQLADSDPQKALLAEYKKEFEAKFAPDKISTFGGHAYDAIMLVKLAIEKAGSTEPAKLRDALETIQGFSGTGGIFNMTVADHNGLTKDAFVMVEIKNKDWAIIKP